MPRPDASHASVAMAGAQMGRGRTPTLAAASAVSEFEFSELDFDNCLGSGTYGAVLSGKFISGELTGKDVAAKFPRRLSTWWGTRFNDADNATFCTTCSRRSASTATSSGSWAT